MGMIGEEKKPQSDEASSERVLYLKNRLEVAFMDGAGETTFDLLHPRNGPDINYFCYTIPHSYLEENLRGASILKRALHFQPPEFTVYHLFPPTLTSLTYLEEF